MKRTLSIIMALLLVGGMSIAASAASFKNDKAVVFNPDGITETSPGEAWKPAGSEASVYSFYTWKVGSLSFADNSTVLTANPADHKKPGKNLFEAVIDNTDWQFSVDYKYMKIRYKSSETIADAAAAYYVSGNHSTGTIPVTCDGKWHEDVIDMTKIAWSDYNWSEHIDDSKNSPNSGKAVMRSFRLDWPEAAGAQYTIDYIAFFKTEADAQAFDGTEASLEAAAPTKSPTTADPIVLALAAAVVSGAGVAAAKKRSR